MISLRGMRILWLPTWLLTSQLGVLVSVCASRQLQEQQQQPGIAVADPLQNVAPRLGIDGFLQDQDAPNDSLLVNRLDAVMRFTGAGLIPFTSSKQRVVLDVLGDLGAVYSGFAEFVSYREFYVQHPDPATPSVLLGGLPAVDLALTARQALPRASVEQIGASGASTEYLKPLLNTIFQEGANGLIARDFVSKNPPILMDAYINVEYFRGGYTPQPLVVMNVTLTVTSSSGSGPLRAEQATAVAQTVEEALRDGIGTLVEVVDYTGLGDGKEGQPLRLEVSMFTCKDNATVPSPGCEYQVLEAVLASMMQSADAQLEWRAAGIERVALVGISQRQPPPPPKASAGGDPRAPWHLDRIDQRSLPLDGAYTASASGAGVNVYVLSSGVRADHQEFREVTSTSTSRVKPAWGYQGLDASQDCEDAPDYYGFGTYVASLCCGVHIGPAKDAVIHSVRMRRSCVENYDYQGLLGGLDFVITNHVKPAVLIIDAWWEPPLLAGGAASARREMYQSRLDRLAALNVTVVAAAGPGLNSFDPCNNVLSNHPSVISVASSDINDQASAFGPRNSACIDIFAPGGGLGTALLGASPAGTANYTQVLGRAFAAAPVVAGVAAQYLESHPAASPSEVRRALLEWGTPHTVTGTGLISTTALLYSGNFAGQASKQPTSGTPSGSGGLSTGATVGIGVAAVALLGLSAAAGFVFVARRRRRRAADGHQAKLNSESSCGNGFSSPPPSASWEISSHDIEVLCRPDGSEWLLGEGRYGRVYKALKGGVQEVAVKKLANVSSGLKEMFAKEIDMMRFVSRDANITQFYGAVVQGDEMCLVAEYMEGGDLREALSHDSAGELRWHRRGRAIALDIVKGVHFLHANHVVHRDIKSKNILLGAGGRAKLADVGLALLLQGQDPGPAGYVGTLAWAAPEVLLGAPSGELADIFSLGVVLWEVVTQKVPLRGRLRDVRVPQEAPQGVADAIAACLQHDPSLRPSAKQLYQMLLACGPDSSHGEAGSKGTSGGSTSLDPPNSASSAKQGLLKDPSAPQPGTSVESGDPGPVVINPSRVEFCRDEGGGRVQLGSGSFGMVWKAHLDEVHPLAVKEVWLGADKRVHASFIREANLLWKLRHPNLVGLTGVCVSEGSGLLLMEWVQHGSLHQCKAKRSQGSGQRALGWYERGKSIALDVAMGLHFLHGQKVIHFDIKPSNILIGRHFHAKLADVGLARVMAATHHSLSRNDSMGPPGTLAYMAPELVAGSSKCGPAVDIFSFGILLWEICTGTTPEHGKMQPLSVPQDCPQEVADLFEHCTAADPAGRPTSKELVERLRLAVRDRGTTGSSEGGSQASPADPRGHLPHAVPPCTPGASAHHCLGTEAASQPQSSDLTAPSLQMKTYVLPKQTVLSPFEALRQAAPDLPTTGQAN